MTVDLFNNREKALLIWFSIGLLWVFSKKDIRHSIFEAVKAFFVPQVLIIYSLMSFYVLGTVFILSKLNLWSPLLIKDTVIWWITIGFALLLNITKNSREEGYFRNLFGDTIKITFAIEFIVNFYTFSLLVEIVLMPVLILILMSKAFMEAKAEERYKNTIKLINYILTILGLYLVIYVLSNVLANFQSLVSLDNRQSILLSPLLTIAYIPFLYTLSLFFAYNQFFTFLTAFLKSDEPLATFAKRRIFLFCNINLLKFNRFIKEYRMRLYHLHNQQELFELFREFEGKRN